MGVLYDTPPKLALSDPIVSEIAHKSGCKGTVLVKMLINANGEILKTKIEKSTGNAECDEAAITALKSGKWEPATKDGYPIKAWIVIPFRFGHK